MITTRIQKTFSIEKENHTLITSSGKDPFNRNDVSYFTWFSYRVTVGSVKSFTNTTIHSHTHTHTHTHNHTYTHRQTHTQTNTYADIYLLVVRERSIYLWEENVKRLKVNTSFHSYNPAGNDMFKVNNRNTKTRYKLYSKLEIKTPERHQVSLLLTLNKFQTFF